MSAHPERVYAVYLPYLPLASRARVGRWTLIPRADLQDSDAIDERTADLGRKLACLYALPRQAAPRDPVGAFGCLEGQQVGDDPLDPTLMADLRSALVITIIDGNESPLIDAHERDPNAGYWAMSSENATVVAAGIRYEGGWTGSLSGGRIPMLSLGIPLDPVEGLPPTDHSILPPADLMLPSMARTFDTEYADAVWQSIRRGTDGARRLVRAIEWLRLAWLNTSDLTGDLRVPALRAGFEVLLDHNKTEELAKRLAALLGDDTASVTREWVHSITGEPISRDLTTVEWWFWRFSFLRNDLMHGGAPAAAAWSHYGKDHVDLSSGYLAQAIKRTVISDGHPDIRDDLLWRRAIREARSMWSAQIEEPE